MSKKRLEEIKNSYLVGIHSLFGTPWVSMSKENADWLIEQAKEKEFYEVQSERKTEALKEIISLLQDDYFENWEEVLEVAERNKNDFVRMEKLKDDLKIRTTKELLIEQNKRYREAIKKAIEEEEQNLEGYESEVYKILTKALESGY